MATRREKAKWLVKLLKVIVVVYLLLILYQLIGNVYSRLSNTHMRGIIGQAYMESGGKAVTKRYHKKITVVLSLVLPLP